MKYVSPIAGRALIISVVMLSGICQMHRPAAAAAHDASACERCRYHQATMLPAEKTMHAHWAQLNDMHARLRHFEAIRDTQSLNALAAEYRPLYAQYLAEIEQFKAMTVVYNRMPGQLHGQVVDPGQRPFSLLEAVEVLIMKVNARAEAVLEKANRSWRNIYRWLKKPIF